MKQDLRRDFCTAIVVGAMAVVGGTAVPGALAVPEHSFDAGLSLEGGCVGEDGIADPGCPGGQHPPKPFFDDSCGVAVDRNGDIYTSSAAIGNGLGEGGRIDVFNPRGEFLSEIPDKNQPCDLAVDSEGHLYVADHRTKSVVLFKPESYPPEEGEQYSAKIIYEDQELGCTDGWAVAVDPSNDHLYVGLDCMIVEYASAAEGSGLVREGIGSFLPALRGIDVSGNSHNLYVTSAVPGSDTTEPANARLYVLDESGKKVECEASDFSFFHSFSGVGVDQANGDVFVDDMTGNHVVKQLSASCAAIGALPSPPVLVQPDPFAGIAVDDPCLKEGNLCNPSAPYLSPNEGYVYVGSGSEAHKSHVYAYAPLIVSKPPIVNAQEASEVSEEEARLKAEVNPEGSNTTYHFEYVTQAQFEEGGYTEAVLTPEENAGAASSPTAVAGAVAGLSPDTAYRFRAVASNHCIKAEPKALCATIGEGVQGGEGTDASFATYPMPPQQNCPNEALRIGPAAALPDCRAYELVTPAQTNGRIPTMSELGNTNENGFGTDLASADGESLSFGFEGGALPGSEGGGFHDTFAAKRGADGWQSEFSGLRGSETTEPYMGGISPDNNYSFWFTFGFSAANSLSEGNYLRGPGGVVEPIGLGSLGSDLEATGNLITAGGTHVIFTSAEHLEPQASENPPGEHLTATIYDRAVGGETKVVSLLPGDIAPSPPSEVEFQGASPDGSAVAFKVNGTLYLRRGGETQEVAAGNPAFGGISGGSGRLTYLVPKGMTKGNEPLHGDVFSYDASSEETKAVGSGGESFLVNVSPDGSHVFFVSPKELVEGEGIPGEYNLYVWDISTEAIGFISTVTERDVFGEAVPDVGGAKNDGLALWVNKVLKPVKHKTDGPGADPSRTTSDGTTFLFESHAPLTPYANKDHSEIYRYSTDEGLNCLSCNPTGVSARSDARMQSPIALFLRSLPPVNALAHISNLSADGKSAFFESADPLVAADNDGKVDVYEWEAEGKGECKRAGGCLAMISSPHSDADDYLYAATPDGQDVFIETADPLLPSDPDGGNSIYDARVLGGFAEAPLSPAPCQGADACRTPSPPPALPGALAGPFAGQNVPPPGRRRCAKRKKARTSQSKESCKKRHHHRHGRKAQ